MSNITNFTTCPYCEKVIISHDPDRAHTEGELMAMGRRLSAHKARCPQKRYLGGTLTITKEGL